MSASPSMPALSKGDAQRSILIIGLMFFIFGFVSWVNAILIPYFKIGCELNNFQAYFVTFAFYISYFVMSVPAAFLLNRWGFKRGMMWGFWVMALGAFIFIPAAQTRTYPIFLLGLFTLGAGLAILQTAANPYITILGPKERAAQRIAIMGIFNKGAGVLAPLVFAAVILKASDQELFQSLAGMSGAERAAALDEFVARVRLPYAVVGLVLLGLGLMVRYSPLPSLDLDSSAEEKPKPIQILQYPHLILGALAIFLHVGTQVIAIDSVIAYAGSMQVPLLEAKVFPSYTLGATIIGYILGIVAIPRWISQVQALQICTLLGTFFTLGIQWGHGPILFFGQHIDLSLLFVLLLGLANSLIWAGIWPLALDGLGHLTKLGASILIMGLSGNAILPLFYGYFADAYDLQRAYWVLLPCYLYLVFYAFIGHKIRKAKG